MGLNIKENSKCDWCICEIMMILVIQLKSFVYMHLCRVTLQISLDIIMYSGSHVMQGCNTNNASNN